MNRSELIATVLVLLATVGTVAGVLGVEKYRRSKLYTLELLAREPDHGNWYPRTIHVPYGNEVRLLVRNVETVTHGFALPEFGVAVREIRAGEAVEVRFRADKKGTFPFLCTVWCSPRHLEMNGKLVVQ